MNLIEFYTKVLEGFNLQVSDDGFIRVRGGDEVLMCAGKTLVLPLPEHINSAFTTDEDGKTVVAKVLYNPINEDIVRGDSASLKTTKLFAEQHLGFSIACVGELLLRLACDKNLQQSTKLEINKFMKDILVGGGQNIKQIIDEKTVTNWTTICNEFTKNGDALVEIFLKKKGTHDGKEYNRLAVMHSKLYDELLKADKDTPVGGIKLRNKDLAIFKTIFPYILGELSEDNTICVGSNNAESPAFVSLMILYLKRMERISKLLEGLKHVDESIYDMCALPNQLLSEGDIYELDGYKTELVKIPTEVDLNRSIQLPSSTLARPDMASAMSSKIKEQPVAKQGQPYPSTIVAPQQPEEEESDPVARALFGSRGNGGFTAAPVGLNNPALMQSQPIYPTPMPQMNMMQHPMVGVPVIPEQPAIPLNQQQVMGVNSLQRPNPGMFMPNTTRWI